MLNSRTFQSSIAGLLAVAGMALTVPAALAGGSKASAGETSVSADYSLVFNGLSVGRYKFSSSFDGLKYSARSHASVSALFGAFRWSGQIAANGQLEKETPKPSAYQMEFKGKSKGGSVRLTFNAGSVRDVELVPNKPPSREAVPLEKSHFRNVFDPVSAIFAMTNTASDTPCNRRVPIFDGKARFDLVLSYKGEERIKEKAPSGLPAQLIVCRVKYVPIAGHKPKDFENPWVDYDRIEIAMRFVPAANLYVPYRISVPTTLGAAEMRAQSIDISVPDRPQIALRN